MSGFNLEVVQRCKTHVQLIKEFVERVHDPVVVSQHIAMAREHPRTLFEMKYWVGGFGGGGCSSLSHSMKGLYTTVIRLRPSRPPPPVFQCACALLAIHQINGDVSWNLVLETPLPFVYGNPEWASPSPAHSCIALPRLSTTKDLHAWMILHSSGWSRLISVGVGGGEGLLHLDLSVPQANSHVKYSFETNFWVIATTYMHASTSLHKLYYWNRCYDNVKPAYSD